MAADSTGFSTRRYETWLGLKGRGARRGWLKLHVVVALESLAILSLAITCGTRHDSPLLRRLVKPIPRGGGCFLADSAYLSRANCDLAAEKGRRPLIRPKDNTKARSRGSWAWKGMVTLYREYREAFMAGYQWRSVLIGQYYVAVLTLVSPTTIGTDCSNHCATQRCYRSTKLTCRYEAQRNSGQVQRLVVQHSHRSQTIR